jgi:hypothetical protein
MKKNKLFLYAFGVITIIAGAVLLQACKKSFLDAHPYGSYTTDLIKNKKGLDALLIGVYGVLDGQGVAGDPWETSAVNWATAGVACDDAYKGTDANDQPQMTEVETYKSQPTNRYFYNKWRAVYEGVRRANIVIKLADDPDITLTAEEKKNFMGQARFLRGHYHFEAKTTQGKAYGLQDAYWKNFDPTYDNNSEEVFGIASAASGNVDGSGERSLGLAFPYGGDFGCCGFFQPSQNLVNAYKTGNDGLPLFTTFNNTDLKNDEGLKDADPYTNDVTTPLDPRLDWSVGRRGVPFWDWGPMPGYSWIRDQNYAGPFSPKKHIFSKKEENVLTSSGWKNITAKDIYLIRYADVLLMAAEAEIEVGSLETARTYINLVRARAKNPNSWVQGAPANYTINLYTTPFSSQAYARDAVRFERRLELAQEGHRFFDLVRWGIAADVLNTYVEKEKLKRVYLQTASFTAGKNEYFPIPATIIDLAAKDGDILTQNPGY